jgi:hypothetical protein
MSSLLALSLSIAVLGAIWAWICIGLTGGVLLVWAGFIAWGCFFHTGGDTKALIKTICGNVYGVIIAWIALLLIFSAGIADAGAVAIAIVVGATVFLLVIVASIEQLSAVPANVYGYAATVAFALSAHVAGLPTLTAPEGAAPEVAKAFEDAANSLAAIAGGSPLGNLTSGSFRNPLVALIASMVLGAVAGWISGQVSKAITKK